MLLGRPWTEVCSMHYFTFESFPESIEHDFTGVKDSDWQPNGDLAQ